MIRILFKYIRTTNLSKKNSNILLGRWEHRHNDKQKDFKSIWANSDNCGDYICGNPNLIDTIRKKK